MNVSALITEVMAKYADFGIDLAIDANAITTLVGANGAGKSTTLLALSGLVPGMVKGLTGQTVGSRVLLVVQPADG